MSSTTNEQENTVQCHHKLGEDWADGCCKSQKTASAQSAITEQQDPPKQSPESAPDQLSVARSTT